MPTIAQTCGPRYPISSHSLSPRTPCSRIEAVTDTSDDGSLGIDIEYNSPWNVEKGNVEKGNVEKDSGQSVEWASNRRLMGPDHTLVVTSL